MLELKKIEASPGLVFDAWIEGPADGDLVLLLHGFPHSRHTWREQVSALAAAGYRAVAPDQRGYSLGARPDPGDLANYALDRLVEDALAIADVCARPGGRFHLVGHDFGGQVAWAAAAARPQGLASLTILSRPHPNAFTAAVRSDEDQQRRSGHHTSNLDPATAQRILADDASRLRSSMAASHVPAASIQDYLSVVGNEGAMEAALAWYRAGGLDATLPPTEPPTLYLWGDADSSVGRRAAEDTAAHVRGDFRFEVLPGVGHFSADQVPGRVTELLLQHIRRHPA
jgi:pimeloyl-ACP methyl ester carboxylesterase